MEGKVEIGATNREMEFFWNGLYIGIIIGIIVLTILLAILGKFESIP